MSDIARRLAKLSPEQLVRLQQNLGNKGAVRAKAASPAQLPARRRQGEPAPLSFGQERMWFADQLQPGSSAYNVPLVLPMLGSVSVPLLEQCITEIIRRHEALRTIFQVRDGRVVQAVQEAEPVRVPVVEFRSRDNVELQRQVAVEVQRPFDLERGPLLHVTLVRMPGAGPSPEGAAGEAPDPAKAPSDALVCVMHHIVSDGWSLNIFVRELGVLYEAFSTGKASPLPELPIQYADFALWQRETLAGKRLADLLSHWRDKLSGAPLYLELPTDRPRSAMTTGQGSVHAFTLPGELQTRLRALCERAHTTSFMTLLAAFNLLLSRYANTDDIVVGTPIANRGRKEIEGLIGFFLNTLPLRTRLSGDPSFLELLEGVRQETLDAFAHQDLPFEMLVEAIKPDRSLSVHAIFQVMFVLQSAAAEVGAGTDGGDPGAVSTGRSRFDLTLSLFEFDGRIDGAIEYSTELFDAATIARIAEHFRTLVEDIAEHPEKRLSELSMLSSDEAETLRRWNDTAGEFEAAECIHHYLERQAKERPDAIGLDFEGEALTYAEWNTRANLLAHHLRSLGVGAETIVGLFTERSIEMMVGLFGILKAGGAYVPLDPTYPADRLRFLLSDTGVSIVVSHAACADSLPAFDGQLLLLDRDWPVIAESSAEAPSSGVGPDHVAYVIYTSGSTGKPKGVVVPHRGVCNAAEVEHQLYRTGPDDRVLQFASLNFDASMFEFVMSILGGSTLQLVRAELLRSGPDFIDFVVERGVTVLPMPPSALATLPVVETPDLRLMLVMGEECPTELVDRWRQVPEFFNCYGPTEASMWMLGTFLVPGRPVVIGRPIANTRCHLLDGNLQQVPVGIPGEIYIGGVCVTRGYLDRPGLTAERFLPDPFSDTPGARMYRTSDRAVYTPEGDLIFLGRLDSQVKIRAFRVELGEIEAALVQHPSVQVAVVAVRDDLPSGRGLVGYIIREGEKAPSTSELRRFLLERLPDYMIPAVFMELAELPLTQAGKADRRALPAPSFARPELEEEFLAPTTQAEQIIAGIWAEVLGLPKVGIEDNFFELGGHSLLATQIIARMREAFQLDLPIRHVFEQPTVRGLSEIVQSRIAEDGTTRPATVARAAAAPGDASRPGVMRQPEQTATGPKQYPLSFAQERLWFLRQLAPDDISYNVPTMFPLGAVESERLRVCLDEIVRRHEILRTTFRLEVGRPVQAVAPSLSLELPVIDLRNKPEADRQARCQQIFARETQSRFDLGKGPLLRCTLVLMSDEQSLLVVVMDHIVTDGWSLGLLFQELAALYGASLGGVPSPLPALPLQYGEHAREQRERLQGAALARDLEYWRERLQGLPTRTDLPLDHPRSRFVHDSTGALQTFEVPAETTARLRELAQELQTTLFTALLALTQAFLWRYTGHEAIAVGSPVSNRNRVELEPLIGFFVNMLVLRADLSDAMGFRELLEQVRETALAAFSHQELPFEKLIEELQPERDPSVNPIFQAMFSYQTVAKMDQASIETGLMAIRSAQFEFSANFADDGEALLGCLTYRTALFESGTIERMAGHFRRFMTEALADVDRPMLELPLMTGAEVEEFEAWHRTDANYDTGVCLDEFFLAQAKRTPDAVAAVFEDEELSYAELARRATRVAVRLRELGVREESLVGICLERSLDLITGVLGVLLAGGAYVPLDPELPDERLLFMAGDAGLCVILTADAAMERLASSQAQLVRVRDAVVEGEEAEGRIGQATPQNAAYAIYTSGSTGRPKGVINDHRGVVNRLLWMQETYGLSLGDRVLQKTSIGFDVSVWELIWPLLTGATQVFARPGLHGDPSYLADAIARHGITHMHFVPSMLQVFLDGVGSAELPSLRCVICSGEELTPALQALFFERLGREGDPPQLYNLYGPTEAAIDVTWWTCKAGDGRQRVPIGHAIANTQVYVLDQRWNQTPVGITGEIYIGGTAPARGYLGRPSLTAERFLPDPFSSQPGARMYRTGDLGRRLRGGEIEYLGRIDHQVKIRGVRIELGEISATMLGHPGVREAVVQLDEGSGSMADKRLVAYYVPDREHGATLARQSLQRWLHQRLPQHMVPALFVELEALPLTPNGKLDRKALPKPQLSRAQIEGAYVAPTGDLEELITSIWVELLRIDRVGMNDNFFELGGHSLLVVQVVTRLQDMLDIELSVVDFFNRPTPALLITELRSRSNDSDGLAARASAVLEVSRLSDEEIEARMSAPPGPTP